MCKKRPWFWSKLHLLGISGFLKRIAFVFTFNILEHETQNSEINDARVEKCLLFVLQKREELGFVSDYRRPTSPILLFFSSIWVSAHHAVKLYLGFWYQAFYPGSSNQHLFSSQEPCAKHNFWCRKHQRKLFQRKTCDGECKQELPLGTKR